MQRGEHISMLRIMTRKEIRSAGVVLTSICWPYRVSEGQHLVCSPAQDQITRRKTRPAACDYSPDRLRPLRLRCVVSAVRGWAGEREGKGQASSNRPGFVVTGGAPGPGARPGSGTTHPLLNLTSIIRMPDSASNVKIVLVRGQRSSPFVETSVGRRIFPGFFQRPEARDQPRGGRRKKPEARQQRDMQL